MKYVGRRRADGRSGSRQKKSLPVWQETLLLLGTALILALVIKTFFIQAFYIPSGSMRETLQVNDRILVQKVSYWFGDVERGDIVVFDDRAGWLGREGGDTSDNLVVRGLAKVGLYPTGGHLVKRVIGVGGDNVRCADGKVFVNGTALDEDSYVTLPKQACDRPFEIEVPEDRLWVMGDNRNHSADSRMHQEEPGKGTIPVDDVVGKVFVVVWPISHWDVIGRPDTFDSVNDASGLATTLVPAGLALMVGYPLYRRRRKESRADDR
jgi:signal peptidase I